MPVRGAIMLTVVVADHLGDVALNDVVQRHRVISVRVVRQHVVVQHAPGLDLAHHRAVSVEPPVLEPTKRSLIRDSLKGWI